MILPALKNSLSLNGFQVTNEILQVLVQYINLLQEWNQRINLTAHRELKDIIEKDIIDSFYLSRCITQVSPHFKSAIDMGCGAGFLGFILGLLNPNAQITLLDSNRKKINFIRQVIRETKINRYQFLNLHVGDGARPQEQYELVASRATWQAINFVKNASYYVQNKGALFLMSGISQEKPAPEALASQGLESVPEFIYEILPEKYQRKIFIFKPVHFT